MGVSVAEYRGIRTDGPIDIMPVPISKKRPGQKPILPCPFKNSHCDKAKRGDKPVCSVRDTGTGALWITCEHRLCATSPNKAPLSTHQTDILHEVAQIVFDSSIQRNEVLYKREVKLKVTEDSDYKADYVMWRRNPQQTSPFNPNRAMIVEMQGGGETQNTGVLTDHIDAWELAGKVDNARLALPVSSVGPLVTNAWRRQQEQFLVKGNVAMLTGGRMVFCVGSMLFDYLKKRFRPGILTDLRHANWSLALLTFREEPDCIENPGCAPHSIQLRVDTERTIFTNYSTFVQVLINQAEPSETLFMGEYKDLLGGKASI